MRGHSSSEEQNPDIVQETCTQDLQKYGFFEIMDTRTSAISVYKLTGSIWIYKG